MSSRPTLLLLLLCLVARHVDGVCLELWDPELCHDGNLTLFPNDGPTDPACLDGSKYGVYFRKSPSASTKWTIFLQGGGWCYNERDCLERSKTSIGSSVHWQQTSGCGCMNIAEDGRIEDDCNCLFLPYGDGASFSGFRTKPWPVNGTNKTLTFRGIKNLDASLDWAFQNGLADATEFVLTGGSAGGLSTFLHADRVAARVSKGAAKVTKIRAAPFTGFFLDHGNFHHTAQTYTTEMEYVYTMQNMSFGDDGALMAGCEELHPGAPGLCFMSPHMASFIKTPFFMFNSRFDAWQLANINQAGWSTPAEKAAVLQYGTDFLNEWYPMVPKSGRNGAMITTCICHACNWTSFELEGKNSYSHYADWMYGVTAGNASLHIDMRPPNGGGVMTGPHCADFV